MNTFEILKVSENDWFKSYDCYDDLTTQNYLDNIDGKTKLIILIQMADEDSIGVYGVVKKKGLYGFTCKKNNFFNVKETKLRFRDDDTMSFILDDEQTIGSLIDIIDEFLTRHNKVLKNNIKIYYFQDKIDENIKKSK